MGSRIGWGGNSVVGEVGDKVATLHNRESSKVVPDRGGWSHKRVGFIIE